MTAGQMMEQACLRLVDLVLTAIAIKSGMTEAAGDSASHVVPATPASTINEQRSRSLRETPTYWESGICPRPQAPHTPNTRQPRAPPTSNADPKRRRPKAEGRTPKAESTPLGDGS